MLAPTFRPGMLAEGISIAPVYDLAMQTLNLWPADRSWKVADIGGGRGDFARQLLSRFDAVTLVDCMTQSIDEAISCVGADLNLNWPLPDKSFDAVFSLEVIEHLENPRHFAREISRILRPGGYALITTPNQLSLASKACLLLRDQFSQFQDSCYPAHLTALVPQDVHRIFAEAGLMVERTIFTDSGKIPKTSFFWQMMPMMRGKWFSDNVGFLIRSH